MRESKLDYEKEHYAPSTIIAGFDEVGRGAIAGPIVVASVILKSNFSHPLIKDSKQLTVKQREKVYQIIVDNALAIAISIKDHHFVDLHNPKQTSILGMVEAFSKLTVKPNVCLVDFERPQFPNFTGQVVGIVKGDQKALHIASASIIAKVTRDNMMIAYDKQYPNYGFLRHKGYYTKLHKDMLQKYGAVTIHRFSCAPVRNNKKPICK